MAPHPTKVAPAVLIANRLKPEARDDIFGFALANAEDLNYSKAKTKVIDLEGLNRLLGAARIGEGVILDGRNSNPTGRTEDENELKKMQGVIRSHMEFKLQEWFNDGALEEKMSSYLGFDWNDPFAKAGVEMSLAILESSGTVILLSAMRRQYKEEDFQPKLSPAELLSVKKTLSGIRSRQQESIIKILRENVVKYLCYALNESRSKCQVPPNPSVMLGTDPDVQTIVDNFETLSESDQKWIRTILMYSKEIKTNLYIKLYSPPSDPADVDERRAYIEDDNYHNLHVTTESDIRRFYLKLVEEILLIIITQF